MKYLLDTCVISEIIKSKPDENVISWLQLWVAEDLKKRFGGRIIPIDVDVAVKWGEIQGVAELSGKSMPTIDGLIAVSGLVYDCVVVTRNSSDMAQSNAELFNPWLKLAR